MIVVYIFSLQIIVRAKNLFLPFFPCSFLVVDGDGDDDNDDKKNVRKFFATLLICLENVPHVALHWFYTGVDCNVFVPCFAAAAATVAALLRFYLCLCGPFLSRFYFTFTLFSHRNFLWRFQCFFNAFGFISIMRYFATIHFSLLLETSTVILLKQWNLVWCPKFMSICVVFTQNMNAKINVWRGGWVILPFRWDNWFDVDITFFSVFKSKRDRSSNAGIIFSGA